MSEVTPRQLPSARRQIVHRPASPRAAPSAGSRRRASRRVPPRRRTSSSWCRCMRIRRRRRRPPPRWRRRRPLRCRADHRQARSAAVSDVLVQPVRHAAGGQGAAADVEALVDLRFAAASVSNSRSRSTRNSRSSNSRWMWSRSHGCMRSVSGSGPTGRPDQVGQLTIQHHAREVGAQRVARPCP